VLIDDARTPLILSRELSQKEEQALYEQTLGIGQAMVEGADFVLSSRERSIRLTEKGKQRATGLVPPTRSLLNIVPAREHLVRQALMALYVFELDREYIVRDNTVQIVDESTGRIMEDRTWQGGLHQLIEIKEGCPLSNNRETIARISYRKFFERYRRLSGMSGTLLEVAGELYADYDVRTISIPTDRPVVRAQWPLRLYRKGDARWAAAADSAEKIAAEGRPVLVGTRSVEAADRLSRILKDRSVAHRVLSARQDVDEAEAVAEAGTEGRITIATNMAGRGTDIKLAKASLDAGGLHVILTEIHESLRVDRQLFGRSGRQGQVGSCQVLVSLEDEIFARFVPRFVKFVERIPPRPDGTVNPLAARWLRRATQSVAERHNAAVRRENAHVDEQLDRMLAVSGRGE
jgi:preprotein translocase subunit SecA